MKKLIFLFFFFVGWCSFAQKIEITTLLKDPISIRAIQIWDGKVWYTGTDSKFGFVSIKDSLDKKQWRLSNQKLQFRTLAQNKKHFFTINIESPAYFFRIDKKTFQSEIIFKDTLKTAFYDALHFRKDQSAIAFSDPHGSCGHLYTTADSGTSWQKLACNDFPPFHEGEAAFAASNTNIASQRKTTWIASGGKKSRIFRLYKGKWKAFETPFIQGNSSQGIYSIDFYDEKFGIAVGGDYTRQKENIHNIATTRNGGKTWQIQASGKNSGYKTCVKFRPQSQGKDIISVGDQDISFSQDYGKTWKIISEEKNLYTCEWIDANNLILAGKNRVIKIVFK
ncbi:MAG: glycosyl hydrolase [Cloacibacterium sp.]|nr:glycosyl hydrolase [Cloacibacterium sp.]